MSPPTVRGDRWRARRGRVVLTCLTSLMLLPGTPVPVAARSLLWIGATNGVIASRWDIGATRNWLNLADGTPTAYTQSPTVGDRVLFNDAASNGIVTLTTPLKPASITVSNTTLKYELGGPGTMSGTNILVKQGAAALELATPNNYSGGTSNLGGMLQIGDDLALGSGLLSALLVRHRLDRLDLIGVLKTRE